MFKSRKRVNVLLIVTLIMITIIHNSNSKYATDTPVRVTEKPAIEKAEEPDITAEKVETAQKQVIKNIDYSDIIITVAHDFSDTLVEYEKFEKAIELLEGKYEGILIDVKKIVSSDYYDYLEKDLHSGVGPDVFIFYLSKSSRKMLVDNDFLMDLSPYYYSDSELKEKLPQKMLSEVTYNNKIFGYPFGIKYFYIYYYSTIFESSGVNIPRTYKELLKSCEKFQQKGITPMAIGAKDSWTTMFHYGTLALNTAGADAFREALQGERSFMEEPFIKAAYQLQELVKNGFYSEDAMNTGYISAEEQFVEHNAAMYFMGDWAQHLLENDDIEVMLWPIDSQVNKNDRFGGIFEAFGVCSYTEHPDLAEDIAAYLADSISSTQSVPTFVNLNDKHSDFIEAAEGGENFVLWCDRYLENNIIKFFDLCSELFNSDLTPEEFCQAVDEIT